jgi:hypothetical protein
VAPNSCERGKELTILYIVGISWLPTELFGSQDGELQELEIYLNLKNIVHIFFKPVVDFGSE